MLDNDPNIHGRISVLEKGMSDLASGLNTFVNAQREENTRFYAAIGTMSDKFMTALEGVKTVVSSRGQITGQFVLMLIATGLSLVAIIGGAVHFYVSSQVNGPRSEIVQAREQINQIHTEVQTFSNLLSEERIRSIQAITVADTERRMLKDGFDKLEKVQQAAVLDEIHRLRAKIP